MLMRFVPILLLIPSLAMAQQPPASTEQAWHLLYDREIAAHHDDIALALDLQTKLQSLTKENAELKAAVKATANAPTAPTTADAATH